jgi:arabinan endo-1,5-alpha-L-arabinosidase
MRTVLACGFRFIFAAALVACGAGTNPSSPAGDETPTGAQGVHDPSMAKQGSTYYVFSTGRALTGHLPIRCSTDLQNWSECSRVFSEIPAWIKQEIPDVETLWAPDISFFSGKYHVYYSASTFGKNRSIIGLATSPTLDPQSPDYAWKDEGKVVESFPVDDWNAIDPNLVMDGQGRAWLAWGSFWSGIKMRRIDPATGKLSTDDANLYSLAARPRDPPINGSVEAPFVFQHGAFYYLFVSFDFCCRGAESTYNVRVGRSAEPNGPFVDKNGVAMLDGGGTLLLQGNQTWRGPGGQSVVRVDGADLLVYHAYSATTGKPSLKISTIRWVADWPEVSGP